VYFLTYYNHLRKSSPSFLRFSTSVPGSATTERLFSRAGLVLCLAKQRWFSV